MTLTFWLRTVVPIALGALVALWLVTREPVRVCNPLFPASCEP